jgi:hypothetical protein
MRIRTRFNRTNNIFFLLENAIHHESVERIHIEVDQEGRISIYYGVAIPTTDKDDYTWIAETDAFDIVYKLFESMKQRFDGTEPEKTESEEDDPGAMDEVIFNQ